MYPARERFGASGGVTRSLQTTEEAEGNRGGRHTGRASRYACRSPLAIRPKALSRGVHGYFNRLVRYLVMSAVELMLYPQSSALPRLTRYTKVSIASPSANFVL